ncbi:hypothetical protein [Natranaerobius thermophilus]|uniref:Alpha-ribazole kinase n=1 Tax=Natranaerobius thermophilus (strain ATCC BAA-1301 / DSM 18059 / JW/NM-WN-LF) TaxID=457570 RepID=B2A0G3_NATTJ|nr:hypothetical protein [Natranaerobius thermophilus]ACB84524.1 conserved hypothetical protein [Natranaerobius thermophilus JW/NM-WN-LF]
MIFQLDDVKMIKMSKNEYLAVACDSLGGIGEKSLDKVKVPCEWVGRVLTRVAVMELLALRIDPFLVINTLANEMVPTGEQIISGIKEELDTVEIDPEISLTGSCETNIVTDQTGAGVTVLGKSPEFPGWGYSYPGIALYMIGTPKVGAEVDLNDPEIMDLQTMKELSEINGVLEILPVGSQGLLKESNTLANRSELRLQLNNAIKTDEGLLTKSAGPSTCVIFTADHDGADQAQKLAQVSGKKMTQLGRLY